MEVAPKGGPEAVGRWTEPTVEGGPVTPDEEEALIGEEKKGEEEGEKTGEASVGGREAGEGGSVPVRGGVGVQGRQKWEHC